MSIGVIYIATGTQHIEEACQSAISLKQVMPELSVTLFSDQPRPLPYFDHWIQVEQPSYSFFDKIQYMYQSPYDYTLFLDTDTYICADFLELFELLERFDLAACHAPTRVSIPTDDAWIIYQMQGVPASFPELNSGVILFRKTPQVQAFFQSWYDLYTKQMQAGPQVLPDQPALREALYRSQLRLAILTPEYNCRFILPIFVSQTVKILHGRHLDRQAIAQSINAQDCARVFVQWDTYLESTLSLQWRTQQQELQDLRTQLSEIQGSWIGSWYQRWRSLRQRFQALKRRLQRA